MYLPVGAKAELRNVKTRCQLSADVSITSCILLPGGPPHPSIGGAAGEGGCGSPGIWQSSEVSLVCQA